MTGTLAVEAAKAKSHPVQLNARERKVCQIVKTAVDASAALKQNVITMAQAVTATGANAGKITIAGMTASGVVIVTAAEVLSSAEMVISHVVAGSGIITVYEKDTSATGAASGVSGKKINYLVVSL